VPHVPPEVGPREQFNLNLARGDGCGSVLRIGFFANLYVQYWRRQTAGQRPMSSRVFTGYTRRSAGGMSVCLSVGISLRFNCRLKQRDIDEVPWIGAGLPTGFSVLLWPTKRRILHSFTSHIIDQATGKTANTDEHHSLDGSRSAGSSSHLFRRFRAFSS
jgi:hypothetical protein